MNASIGNGDDALAYELQQPAYSNSHWHGPPARSPKRRDQQHFGLPENQDWVAFDAAAW